LRAIQVEARNGCHGGNQVDHFAATGSYQQAAGVTGRAQRPGGSFRWLLSARFCWGLAVATLLLSLATAAILVIGGDLLNIVLIPTCLIAPIMGSLVAERHPGHPMGVLLSGYGFTGIGVLLTIVYGRAAVVWFPGDLPFGRQVMWLTAWDFVVPVTLALILPLVFPTGRLLSARWRPALWAAAAFAVLATAGNAFAPESMGIWFGDRPNPYAVPGPLFKVILAVGSVCGLIVAVAVIVNVAYRWRRAGHVERQQLKWPVASVPFLILAVTTATYFPNYPDLTTFSARWWGCCWGWG
jgi:hypothetical protein